MKHILILDTYYSDFIAGLPPIDTDYETALQGVLDRCFGTFDSYSRGLRALGWTAIDVIGNYDALQSRWLGRRIGGFNRQEIALAQIDEASPDVVFLQDLSFFSLEQLRTLSKSYLLAGQCSCEFSDNEKLKQCGCLFTSFPFYVERFNRLGIHAQYLPLAFDPIIWDRIGQPDPIRHRNVVFVGGIGRQWTGTLPILRAIADQIPTAEFYGYGYDRLELSDPIRQHHCGEAWGLTMYEKFVSARIVLNRHGEIAGNYANNLRLFEATGCGAMLLTDEKSNMRAFFAPGECVTYSGPQDAVDKARYYLAHDDERAAIAANGQARTLKDHTYAQRMPMVSDTLIGLLASVV